MKHREVREAIGRALEPGRFFVSGGMLESRHQPAEQTHWEIFRGHLLDHRQTRALETFESWDLLLAAAGHDAPGPQTVVSLKWAAAQGRIYVTRELLVYGEEVYEPEPDVIATRAAQVAERELVGTVDVERFGSIDLLTAELSQYVLLALVGTSRLPITSLESPLPAFSLGRLAYAPSAAGYSHPASSPAEWLERAMPVGGPALDHGRTLEVMLRAAELADIPALAGRWQQKLASLRLGPGDTVAAVKSLFNHVALTPYTSLVDNLVRFLHELAGLGALDARQSVDVVGYLLRHLARHLAAFDLVTFHNQGANYPDALLLEALWTDYVAAARRWPELFLATADATAAEYTAADLTAADAEARNRRLRRRALRQAWLVRSKYAGHLVPDLPTSPGENVRVLYGVSQRVPAEQLLRPERRRKRLFAAGADRDLPPLAAQVLAKSLDDLDHPAELAELGTAVFLDRPLGIFHDSGAPDRTPLVSYQAFSRQVAAEGLRQLAGAGLTAGRLEQLQASLDRAAPRGLPAAAVPSRASAGVVALGDAMRAAADFAFIRTTRSSLHGLLAGYDLSPLARDYAAPHRWLTTGGDVLLVRTAQRSAAEQGADFLTAFDGGQSARLCLAVGPAGAGDYFEAGGVELLRAGFRITQIDGARCNLAIQARG